MRQNFRSQSLIARTSDRNSGSQLHYLSLATEEGVIDANDFGLEKKRAPEER